MAAPVIAGIVNSTAQASGSNTGGTVPLPADVAAGNLLLVFTAQDGGAYTVSWAAGWTELFDSTGGGVGFAAAYKIAAGGETGVAITYSSAERQCQIALRITGNSTTEAPLLSAVASANSSTPNTAVVNASDWGAEDKLYISAFGIDNPEARFPVTTFALTNYTSECGIDTSSAAGLAFGATTSTATSLDPGNFVITSADTWVGYTLAVRTGVTLNNYTIEAGTAAYVITGTAALLERDATVSAAGGTYEITGTACTLTREALIVPDSGVYEITGTAVTLTRDGLIVPDAGEYLLTGSNVTFDIGMPAESGAYEITGTAVTLLRTALIEPEAGAYEITGAAATLGYGKTINVDAGEYTLIGTAATFAWTHILDAGAGTYEITGTDADLEYLAGYSIEADSGVYTISGTDAALLFGRVVVPDAGSYEITGSTASLLFGRVLVPEAGSYTLTGTDVDFLRTYVQEATYGTYTLTGSEVTLTYSGGEVTRRPSWTTWKHWFGQDVEATPVIWGWGRMMGIRRQPTPADLGEEFMAGEKFEVLHTASVDIFNAAVETDKKVVDLAAKLSKLEKAVYVIGGGVALGLIGQLLAAIL